MFKYKTPGSKKITGISASIRNEKYDRLVIKLKYNYKRIKRKTTVQGPSKLLVMLYNNAC